MAIITIIKGDRRRQCVEKDFAHFAARGFEKADAPASDGRARPPGAPSEGKAKRPADPVAAPACPAVAAPAFAKPASVGVGRSRRGVTARPCSPTVS